MFRRFRELATGSERGLRFGSEPRGPVGLVALSVWMVFLVFPLGNAIGHVEPALAHALSIVGAAAFVVAYIAIVVVFRLRLSTGGLRCSTYWWC